MGQSGPCWSKTCPWDPWHPQEVLSVCICNYWGLALNALFSRTTKTRVSYASCLWSEWKWETTSLQATWGCWSCRSCLRMASRAGLAATAVQHPPRLSRCPLSTSSLSQNEGNTIGKLREINCAGCKKYSWPEPFIVRLQRDATRRGYKAVQTFLSQRDCCQSHFEKDFNAFWKMGDKLSLIILKSTVYPIP